jgi:hypothetical protein
MAAYPGAGMFKRQLQASHRGGQICCSRSLRDQSSASLEELASADGDRLSRAVIRAPLVQANVVAQLRYAVESCRRLVERPERIRAGVHSEHLCAIIKGSSVQRCAIIEILAASGVTSVQTSQKSVIL